MSAKGPLSAHGPVLFHMKEFLSITRLSSLGQHQAKEDEGRG